MKAAKAVPRCYGAVPRYTLLRQERERWWGGRVAEGDSLENCYTRKGIVGSNPTPTAETETRRVVY